MIPVLILAGFAVGWTAALRWARVSGVIAGLAVTAWMGAVVPGLDSFGAVIAALGLAVANLAAGALAAGAFTRGVCRAMAPHS